MWLAWFLDYVLDAVRAGLRVARRRRARRRLPRVGRRSSPTAVEDDVVGRRLVPARVLRRRHAARHARPPRSAASTRSRRRGRPSRAPATPSAPRRALESVEEKLVRREDGLIALLTPPFDQMAAGPRLHQGLRARRARERRAVHARRAVGRARAPAARRRRRGRGAARPHQPDQPRARRARPPSATRSSRTWSPPTSTPSRPHTGRGGWTWYTGSASWFYRVALHWMLGLRVAADDDGPLAGRSTRASPSTGPASR